MITRFLTSEDGATMAEYALMATSSPWRRLAPLLLFGGQVIDLFNPARALERSEVVDGSTMSASTRFQRLRQDRGASMVEFALILPLLVLLIFGLVEFGRGYNAQITLTHAAREGVRTLAVTKDAGEADGHQERRHFAQPGAGLR